MPGKAPKVVITVKQQTILHELSRSRTCSQCVQQRATIILLAFEKRLNEDIALEVGVGRHQIGLWRKRWQAAWESLCVWECAEPRRLREAILEVLADAPRPGAPAKITATQVAQILAVACEPPDDPERSNRPIVKWTLDELRDEVLKRQIVPTISRSHLGTLLQRAVVQPHRNKMWLNTTEKDPKKFEREAEAVCKTYLDAPTEAKLNGTHTICVDEATSLQALERKAPDKPTQPGRPKKQEFEYVRHGTTTLTAGFDVVTGKIVSPTLEATRTEPQFVEHIARTTASDTTNDWVFVADNLNTHISASLVIWVAAACGIAADLGKKVSTAC